MVLVFAVVWMTVLIAVMVVYPVGEWSLLAKAVLVGLTVATLALAFVLIRRKRNKDTEKMLRT